MNDQKKEMTQEREITILEGAIRKFGILLQVIVAIEELSELQKELTNVSIMLNQLQLIFGDPIEQEITKLERLEGLVQGDVVV